MLHGSKQHVPLTVRGSCSPILLEPYMHWQSCIIALQPRVDKGVINTCLNHMAREKRWEPIYQLEIQASPSPFLGYGLHCTFSVSSQFLLWPPFSERKLMLKLSYGRRKMSCLFGSIYPQKDSATGNRFSILSSHEFDLIAERAPELLSYHATCNEVSQAINFFFLFFSEEF